VDVGGSSPSSPTRKIRPARSNMSSSGPSASASKELLQSAADSSPSSMRILSDGPSNQESNTPQVDPQRGVSPAQSLTRRRIALAGEKITEMVWAKATMRRPDRSFPGRVHDQRHAALVRDRARRSHRRRATSPLSLRRAATAGRCETCSRKTGPHAARNRPRSRSLPAIARRRC
jgi:hypothetical protein